MSEIPFVGRNGLLKSISGAIEIALWDLRGKLLNKPTYQLFPSKRKMTQCYASGGSVIMNNKEIVYYLLGTIGDVTRMKKLKL